MRFASGQEFLEQTRRTISRIYTNIGHRHNLTFAKMISYASGSEENDQMCDSVPVFCVQASVPRTDSSMTLLSDVHFWNFQGREVSVYSLIDEATFMSPKSCHSNQLETCMKRSRPPW